MYPQWVWLAEEAREATQEVLLLAILQKEQGDHLVALLVEYLRLKGETLEETPEETLEVQKEEEDNLLDNQDHFPETHSHHT